MRRTPGETVFDVANTLFLGLLCLSFILPVYIVAVKSFTAESVLLSSNVGLWPKRFSLEAYRVVLSTNTTIARAFVVSTASTVLGTLQGMAVITLFGYAMAKESFPFKKSIMAFVVFTMIFSGGLIPTFLMLKALHLTNTFYVLTIFGAFNAGNMIFIRNYFMSVPKSLVESARLDGAGDWTVFLRIMLPLSKPMLACLTLFTAVAIYNDWTTPLFYNSGDTWVTLQLLLKRILSRIENLSLRGLVLTRSTMPSEGIKAATIVVVITPILLSYPFLQKYFIRGSWLGSIKE